MIKNKAEYDIAILNIARLSDLLCKKLDDEALDLFEEYGNLHESIVKYEILNNVAS